MSTTYATDTAFRIQLTNNAEDTILIDRSGNQEKYYRCIIHKAIVEFSEGKLTIRTEKLDYKDKL